MLCRGTNYVCMYLGKVPYLQESRRGSWEGGDGWIEDCFFSFLFHCVCDMEVTSLIYINHKISSLHY